jgi:hypothetical protein
MNPNRPLKVFLVPFILALAVYFISFYLIENRRTRNGPWQVSFTSDAGAPALVINESKLNITNVKIVFQGEAAPGTNSTYFYSKPQPVPFEVPFGKCIFEDITFQPGTIVFTNFGHEIQLMPRVLTIDRQEHAWRSDETIRVSKADTSHGAP